MHRNRSTHILSLHREDFIVKLVSDECKNNQCKQGYFTCLFPPRNYSQAFLSRITNNSSLQRRNPPCLADGKMYKCGTFGGILPFTPKSFRVGERHCKQTVKEKQGDMEKVKRELRKHFVKTRMNDTELNQLTALHKKSIDKDISSYIRKVLLQKPVIIKYRNETGDDFLKEIISMKKELNAIGNNFNQAVHKLHLLDKIPEFRVWVNQYDGLQKSIAGNVEEIKLRMNKMYEQWLQK